ncbi:hypothetical protein [Metallosphaera hakonensis]|uniref:hypothetical protein n=1 Tax=Metallosphaera hakonensis TaxID=79601 RepID=UPI002093796A|nr:hypothetical protein [Metallosphaera hakonensis]
MRNDLISAVRLPKTEKDFVTSLFSIFMILSFLALTYPVPIGHTQVTPLSTSNSSSFNASGAYFTITFVESGLPPGTIWSVTLNGVTMLSNSSQISISVPRGTYHFTVGSVQGYFPIPSSGTVIVNGSYYVQHITFNRTIIPINLLTEIIIFPMIIIVILLVIKKGSR